MGLKGRKLTELRHPATIIISEVEAKLANEPKCLILLYNRDIRQSPKRSGITSLASPQGALVR
jgi:hypothetical protein